MNVMPKKANFDLKRDVEKKMERLERKTQRAMIELMREEEERRVAEAQRGTMDANHREGGRRRPSRDLLRHRTRSRRV